MADYIIYGDIDSRDYDLLIFSSQIDNAPARQYKEFEISGRSGLLYMDLKRYGNVDHIYNAVCYEDAEDNLTAFRSALLSKVNYQRLEDSFHTDEFYSAIYTESIEPQITRERGMCKFELNFTRKPQRFLKSGETAITISESSGSILNETDYYSKPLIRAYGVGTMTIGAHNTVIVAADEYTDIDSETMLCYKGTMPKGGVVRFTNYEYPTLKPGVNNILLSGITQIDVYPRWYRL